MLDRNKVIALVRSKGPVLPVHITKDLDTSPIFAGAILSELVDSKLLRLSNAKIGGSPVYYVEGQEGKLPGMLYQYLHEKEKKAFDLLKSKGILRDKEEEPVVRVALRAIKDFAVPFEVKKEDYVEIFWKYFLITDSDAEKSIREILASENPAAQEEKKTSRKQKKGKKKPQNNKQDKRKVKKSKQSQYNKKEQNRSQKKAKKSLIKKQSSTSSHKKSIQSTKKKVNQKKAKKSLIKSKQGKASGKKKKK